MCSRSTTNTWTPGELQYERLDQPHPLSGLLDSLIPRFNGRPELINYYEQTHDNPECRSPSSFNLNKNGLRQSSTYLDDIQPLMSDMAAFAATTDFPVSNTEAFDALYMGQAQHTITGCNTIALDITADYGYPQMLLPKSPCSECSECCLDAACPECSECCFDNACPDYSECCFDTACPDCSECCFDTACPLPYNFLDHTNPFDLETLGADDDYYAENTPSTGDLTYHLPSQEILEIDCQSRLGRADLAGRNHLAMLDSPTSANISVASTTGWGPL